MVSNSTSNIFVVDDEELIAFTVAEILRLHGYRVTFFTSSLDALARARSIIATIALRTVGSPFCSWQDYTPVIASRHLGWHCYRTRQWLVSYRRRLRMLYGQRDASRLPATFPSQYSKDLCRL